MFSEKVPDDACPVITPKKLKDINITVGESIDFEASIVGYPVPAIEWLKDSKPLKKAKRVITTHKDNLYKLSITGATLEDAGEYQVVAKNKVASASFSADVTVSPKPTAPKFIKELADQEVSDMEPVLFEVEVKDCDQVSWFLDNVAVEDDEEFEFKKDGDIYSFSIASVNPEDSGKYECRATNKIGTVSSYCQLTVNEVVKDQEDGKGDGLPIIKTELPDEVVQVKEGERFEVSFTITGEPTPEVFFYKGDDPLEDSDYVEISRKGDTYTFTIPELKEEDSGLYIVEVESTTGLVEREFEIKVSRKFLVSSTPFIPIIVKKKVKINKDFSLLPSFASINKNQHFIFI